MHKIQNDLTFHYINPSYFKCNYGNNFQSITDEKKIQGYENIISYSRIIKDIFNMRHKFCKTNDNMNFRYLYLYFVYFCTLSILRGKVF